MSAGLEPLVQVLRSPGNATELHAMPSQPLKRPRPHRVAAWQGVMHRAAVIATVLSLTSFTGGAVVAAAYTANLPEPVQRVAHRALGRIGVPTPRPQRAPKPATVPHQNPAVHGDTHRRLPDKNAHRTPNPTTAVTSLTLHASSTTVPHNQKITLTEQLKVGSKGLAGEPVKLEKRAAGARSFTLVSTKTTNAKGQVTLSVIPGTRKGQKEQYELIFAGNKTDKGSHSRIITITVS